MFYNYDEQGGKLHVTTWRLLILLISVAQSGIFSGLEFFFTSHFSIAKVLSFFSCSVPRILLNFWCFCKSWRPISFLPKIFLPDDESQIFFVGAMPISSLVLPHVCDRTFLFYLFRWRRSNCIFTWNAHKRNCSKRIQRSINCGQANNWIICIFCEWPFWNMIWTWTADSHDLHAFVGC